VTLWLLALLGVNPYREPARAILEDRCGKCHRADSVDANPRALAVFTLNDADFAARMNPQQLRDMLGRFTGEIAPSDGISDAEVRTIRSFVEVELGDTYLPKFRSKNR
jgi:hypothetical protein